MRGGALADALAEEVASCRRRLTADPRLEETADGASSHELARTALTYAWQLLQTTKVLELNVPSADRVPAAE